MFYQLVFPKKDLSLNAVVQPVVQMSHINSKNMTLEYFFLQTIYYALLHSFKICSWIEALL